MAKIILYSDAYTQSQLNLFPYRSVKGGKSKIFLFYDEHC